MMEVPPAIPATVPVAFTVAIVVALLCHVPPVVISDKVVVAPWHTEVVPDTGAAEAAGLTVTTCVTTPVAALNEITAVPAETPVTNPVPETIAATLGEPLLHVPVPASFNVVVPPTQIVNVPVIGAVADAVKPVNRHPKPISSVKNRVLFFIFSYLAIIKRHHYIDQKLLNACN